MPIPVNEISDIFHPQPSISQALTPSSNGPATDLLGHNSGPYGISSLVDQVTDIAYPTTNGRETNGADINAAIDIIDCLNRPPPQITAIYMSIIERVSSMLGFKAVDASSMRTTGARPAWTQSQFPEHLNTNSNTSLINPQIIGDMPDSQDKLRNQVNKSRNDIYAVINKVNSFIARAKNAGFVPPENPFALAMSFNVGRIGFTRVTPPPNIASKIVGNIKSYITLLDAESSGKLNLDTNVNLAAQLSSATLSLDGFGGSGNTSVDLAKLLPDADEVKAQKAFESLSVFDFTKRIPKLIFTSFYAPDGTPKGVIIGWKKVQDASGYVIKRKNIFDGTEVTYTVDNDHAKEDTGRLREYVKAWVLSFYDNMNHDLVYTFLDSDVPPHGYYYYTLKAYQLQNNIPGSLFSTETSPVFLSSIQKESMRKQIEQLDPGAGPDTISPYPILSHVLFGDSKFDWILAAINVRSSINRGDPRSTTRKYSYLSAQLDFLFSQSDNGLLIAPKGKDVSKVMNNIETSISKFGVNQVLKDVLQETGALYHFDGKDANDSTIFSSVDSGNSQDNGLISIVAASIDPETATMNLKTLSTNLPLLLSGEFVSIKESLKSDGRKSSITSVPAEIEFPKEFDNTTQTNAEDEIQYLQKLGNLADGVIDLTTANGIASFMRTVRIFSDIGPGRGAPIASTPQVVVPDPATPMTMPYANNGPIQPFTPPPLQATTQTQVTQEPFNEGPGTSNSVPQTTGTDPTVGDGRNGGKKPNKPGGNNGSAL